MSEIVDSATMTANHKVLATTEATAETIISGQGFVADGTSQYRVEFFAPTARGGLSDYAAIRILLESDVDGIIGIWAQPENVSGSGSACLYPLHLSYIAQPDAGLITYTVTAYNFAGTNGLIGGGVGGNGHTNLRAQFLVTRFDSP